MKDRIKKIVGAASTLLVMLAIMLTVSEIAHAATQKLTNTCFVGDVETCVLSNPSGVKIAWTVSNSKIRVLRKNKYGLKFRAKSAGKVKVTAKLAKTKQKVVWTVVIKKRTVQTVDLSSVEYETGTTNECIIPNASGAKVKWKVSNSNIEVFDENNYGISFTTVVAGTTKVTAITDDYKYVWTIVVVDRSADYDTGDTEEDKDVTRWTDFPEGFDDTLQSLSDADLDYYTEVIKNYVEGIPQAGITLEGVYNFVEKVLYYVVLSDSTPTEAELFDYMKTVDYCLYQ